MTLLDRVLGRTPPIPEPGPLYAAVVAQARRPEFYTVLGVPDTPDGRYDMIALHVCLVLRRLRASDDVRARPFAQALFDTMFADMDQNLREMGVGDLGVGRKVKALAKGLYGRLAAYGAGLDNADAVDLDGALRRNLYRKCQPDDAQVAALAGYTRDEARRLDAASIDQLSTGDVGFGAPPNPHPAGAA